METGLDTNATTGRTASANAVVEPAEPISHEKASIIRGSAGTKKQTPRSYNHAFGRSIHELPNRFDGLSVLAAQSGLGPFHANIEKVDLRSSERRERHGLTHDGAATGISRAVDFKHAESSTLKPRR